jgi:hypothetical protein
MKKSYPVRIPLCLLAALVGGFVSQARAAELVVNGGFDDDNTNFVGWTHGGDTNGFDSVGNDPLFSVSPPNHANLGSSPDLGSLSQTLSTVTGQSYSFSFWLRNDGGADTGSGILNSFTAIWNGTPVLSLTNSAEFNYTQFTYIVQATSSSTVIEFDYRNDAEFFRLDSVSVQQVPEPSTALLGVLGFGLFGLRQYQKLRRRF